MADFSLSPSQIPLPASPRDLSLSPASPPYLQGPPPRPLRGPQPSLPPHQQPRQISLRINAHLKPLYELCKTAASHKDFDRFDDLIFSSIAKPLTEGGDVELAKKGKELVVGRGKHIFEERRRGFGGLEGEGRKRDGGVVGFRGDGRAVEGGLDGAFECMGRGDKLGFRGWVEELRGLWVSGEEVGEGEGEGEGGAALLGVGKKRAGSGFEDLVVKGKKIEMAQIETSSSFLGEEVTFNININSNTDTDKSSIVCLPTNQSTTNNNNDTKNNTPVSKAKIQALMREIHAGIKDKDVTIFLDCMEDFEPFPHDLQGVADVTEEDVLRFQEGALNDAIEDGDEEWFVRILREASFGWGVQVDAKINVEEREEGVEDLVGAGVVETGLEVAVDVSG